MQRIIFSIALLLTVMITVTSSTCISSNSNNRNYANVRKESSNPPLGSRTKNETLIQNSPSNNETENRKPELVLQWGHTYVNSFSPDGRFIATYSGIRDVKSGRLIRELKTQGISSIDSLYFLPDGNHIISRVTTVDNHFQVVKWNVKTGDIKEIIINEHSCAGYFGRDLSPDGRIFAYIDQENIRLIDVEKNKLYGTFELGAIDGYSCVSFSPDGKKLACGGDNGIVIWDVLTGQITKTMQPIDKDIDSIKFMPDGNKILARSRSNKNIMLLDFNSGKLLQIFENNGLFELSPDGKILALTKSNRTVELLELNSGKVILFLKKPISSLAFSHDSKLIATGGKTLNLWNLQNKKILWSCEINWVPINQVSLINNGKLAAWGANSKQACYLRSKNKLSCIEWIWGRKEWWFEDEIVLMSPEGNLFAMVRCSGLKGNSCAKSTIKLIDTRKGNIIQEIEVNEMEIRVVAFSRNGNLLAAGGHKNVDLPGVWYAESMIQIFDVETGRLITPLALEGNLEPDIINSLSFNSTGDILASGSEDGVVIIWDINKAKEVKKMEDWDEYSVDSIDFHREGKTVATGGKDWCVKLWDTESGEVVSRFEGHKGEINVVKFSPNGEIIASGSDDHTIKLWGVSSGELLKSLDGHSGDITSLTFTNDGKVLVSSSWDWSIKFWDAIEGKLIATWIFINENDWVVFTPDGYFDTSSNGNKHIGWTVGLQSYPAEKYWKRYHRPGLLNQALMGMHSE